MTRLVALEVIKNGVHKLNRTPFFVNTNGPAYICSLNSGRWTYIQLRKTQNCFLFFLTQVLQHLEILFASFATVVQMIIIILQLFIHSFIPLFITSALYLLGARDIVDCLFVFFFVSFNFLAKHPAMYEHDAMHLSKRLFRIVNIPRWIFVSVGRNVGNVTECLSNALHFSCRNNYWQLIDDVADSLIFRQLKFSYQHCSKSIAFSVDFNSIFTIANNISLPFSAYVSPICQNHWSPAKRRRDREKEKDFISVYLARSRSAICRKAV